MSDTLEKLMADNHPLFKEITEEVLNRHLYNSLDICHGLLMCANSIERDLGIYNAPQTDNLVKLGVVLFENPELRKQIEEKMMEL